MGTYENIKLLLKNEIKIPHTLLSRCIIFYTICCSMHNVTSEVKKFLECCKICSRHRQSLLYYCGGCNRYKQASKHCSQNFLR